MASKLKAVAPKAAEPSKPKILIYGKPGVGKTWTALDFPNVYYIDTEGGADLAHYTDKLQKSGGVYFGVDQGSLDFAEVIGQIQALATEQHPYKTLVIDSITKVFNLEIAKAAELLGDKDAFGASKKPAISYMRRLISWLMRLDMNVILIAHEKPLWGMVNGDRAEIGVTFDAWDKLEYELHLCLNIIKSGLSRTAKIKKTRLLGFPDGEIFPWSYEDFASRYGKDVIEKSAQAITLATQEQLSKFNEILGLFNATDEQKQKWLKWGGVEAFEEMDSDKMDTLIKQIIAKIPTINGTGASHAVHA